MAWNGEEVHADTETERQIRSIVDDLLRSVYHAGVLKGHRMTFGKIRHFSSNDIQDVEEVVYG